MPPRENLEPKFFETHYIDTWNPVRKCSTAAPWMCIASSSLGCRSSRRIQETFTKQQIDPYGTPLGAMIGPIAVMDYSARNGEIGGGALHMACSVLKSYQSEFPAHATLLV
jgi:hypothetical protein